MSDLATDVGQGFEIAMCQEVEAHEMRFFYGTTNVISMDDGSRFLKAGAINWTLEGDINGRDPELLEEIKRTRAAISTLTREEFVRANIYEGTLANLAHARKIISAVDAGIAARITDQAHLVTHQRAVDFNRQIADFNEVLPGLVAEPWVLLRPVRPTDGLSEADGSGELLLPRLARLAGVAIGLGRRKTNPIPIALVADAAGKVGQIPADYKKDSMLIKY